MAGLILKMELCPDYTYRIGRDEFVAFCKDLEQEEVVRRVCCIKELAGRHSYEISTGIEWRDSDFGIDSIVKAAEHKTRTLFCLLLPLISRASIL